VVFATTNYELLIEIAVNQAGYTIALLKELGGSSLVILEMDNAAFKLSHVH
jgi:hypothetical protein